jgi:LEA14-like dessication related protein
MKTRSTLAVLMFSFLVSILGSGCSTFKQMAQKPKLSFQGLDIKGLSFNSANLVAKIEVENPNGFEIKVDSVDYDLQLNDRAFTKGSLSEPVKVAGKETKVIDIPVKVKFTEMITLLKDFATNKKAKFLLAGTAKSGMFEMPFKEDGEIELPVD